MISFDTWMADNCTPPANYSYAQYGRYLEGWRNSMPWAYKGMSLAYENWAETKWDIFPHKERLIMAWQLGMQNNYERLERGEKALAAEDAADVVLSVYGAIQIAVSVFSEDNSLTIR